MKKTKKIIALFLALCCVLSLAPASLADGAGLNAFSSSGAMKKTTFSDLDSFAWYYQGINSAYNNGLMIGYPDGTFGPGRQITRAEAIMIAARVHSVYHGKTLPARRPTELWYVNAYDYCASNGLLSTTLKQRSSLNSPINRYDLAYLFARTIDASDMPTISDISMNDLSSIPQYYRDSVLYMYRSGIMNGMYGSFCGSSTATRAQIAAVAARLVEPYLRKGHDGRINSAMADFEANLENDSVAVKLGSTTYCLYKDYKTWDNDAYMLLARGDNGSVRTLYTVDGGVYLNNLSLYNGRIYFCRSIPGTSNGSLLCYDPATGSLGTVYEGNLIESYCFYGGSLYALAMTTYAQYPSGYIYAFGRISGGAFTPYISDMAYKTAKNIVPYGWNGRIYFKLGEDAMFANPSTGLTTSTTVDKLYAYDLASGSLNKVCDHAINTSFFDGHVMYYLAYDANGGYDLTLYAISLQTPGKASKIGSFPLASGEKNRSLYKYGDKFYCLSSFDLEMYDMDATGISGIALHTGGVYDSACFTSDKLVLVPNTLVTSNENEIKIYNASSLAARTLYGDWLDQSVFYNGARFVPEKGQSVFSTGDNVTDSNILNISITKAFMSGTDFIIQAKYHNLYATHFGMREYTVRVYLDGGLVLSDTGLMSGVALSKNDIITFTFVIAKAGVLNGVDLSSGRVRIEISQNWGIPTD